MGRGSRWSWVMGHLYHGSWIMGRVTRESLVKGHGVFLMSWGHGLWVIANDPVSALSEILTSCTTTSPNQHMNETIQLVRSQKLGSCCLLLVFGSYVWTACHRLRRWTAEKTRHFCCFIKVFFSSCCQQVVQTTVYCSRIGRYLQTNVKLVKEIVELILITLATW